MRVVVPYAVDQPKTRLSAVLSPAERIAFSEAMCRDVLDAIRQVGETPELLATAPVEFGDDAGPTGDTSDPHATPVTVDDRPLTTAVNGVFEETLTATADDPRTATANETAHESATDRREGADAVAVVMADLALATPESLERLFGAESEVVAVPGRGGGTNALVVRHPDFRVDYHGASIRDHRRIAREVGAEYAEVDSMRLATDVDEPADLAELLLHGEGRATDWLRDAGFEVDVTDGRVGVTRS
ncbi:2-phospho-L-lactate guanylyltransferase [Salinirubrum litoreum]|uniref:2-phospho-L-lactate guanylyltransferase n=1 Tax=Salinirubrum litoreum TaxID=1126234 RepID=A0ABD5RBV4_9EURY